MIVFSALCIPAILGFLILEASLRTTPLRHKELFLLGISMPTGFGICSLILFVSFLLTPSYAKAISILESSGLILLLLYNAIIFHFKNSKAYTKSVFPMRRLGWIGLKNEDSLCKKLGILAGFIFFIYTLYTITQFYFLSASTNVLGGWDARYFWALKAKFMFRSPQDWQLMFSPELSWSNQDYPLLWPGTLAWGWNWLGQESLLWGPLASFCFYISCVLMVVWYLVSYSSTITAWLAGAFTLVVLPPFFWSVQQYADVPVTFLMTACSLILITALRSKEPKLFMIAGLMGGFSAWTKNEGGLFVVWVYLVLTVTLVQNHRKEIATSLKILRTFTAGALAPCLAAGILKYLSRNSGTYRISAQDLQNHLGSFSAWTERTAVILKGFYDQMGLTTWKGLWGGFILATVFIIFKRQKNDYQKLFPAIILLINSGYFVILLVTSQDLAWQIRTALDRLVIHSSILAVAFTFEALTLRQNAS